MEFSVFRGLSMKGILQYTATFALSRGLSMKALLKTVENRLLTFQLGSEEHFIKTQKGGTPMKNLLTTKMKGGNHNARFYDRAEGTAYLVSLDLGEE